jgi:hypothetical protein
LVERNFAIGRRDFRENGEKRSDEVKEPEPAHDYRKSESPKSGKDGRLEIGKETW